MIKPKLCECGMCYFLNNVAFEGVDEDGVSMIYVFDVVDFNYALDVFAETNFEVKKYYLTQREVTHRTVFVRGQWNIRRKDGIKKRRT